MEKAEDTINHSLNKNTMKSKIGLAYVFLVLLSALSFFQSINISESIIAFSKMLTTFVATCIIAMLVLSDKRFLKYLAIAMVGLLLFDSYRLITEYYQHLQGKISITMVKAGYANKNILAASVWKLSNM